MLDLEVRGGKGFFNLQYLLDKADIILRVNESSFPYSIIISSLSRKERTLGIKEFIFIILFSIKILFERIKKDVFVISI